MKILIGKTSNKRIIAAFLKEALWFRSSSQGLFPREAKENHYLKDVFIKKGTLIDTPFYSNFNNPKIFKNPLEFVPERWLKENPLFDNAEDRDPFLYTPFSAGGRNCIGQHMSMLASQVILLMFFRSFDFALKNKEEDIVWVLKLLVESREPLLLHVKRKSF